MVAVYCAFKNFLFCPRYNCSLQRASLHATGAACPVYVETLDCLVLALSLLLAHSSCDTMWVGAVVVQLDQSRIRYTYALKIS